MALFKVRSREHKLAVRVFGVRDTQFLVWTANGWSWVNQESFVPGYNDNEGPGLVGLTYEKSLFYTGQRPE